MVMNGDLAAKDYVKLRLVDAAGRLTQLIGLYSPELLSCSGVDLYKFLGNLSREVLRLSCLPSFPDNGFRVKCFLYQVAVNHLWYKYRRAVFWTLLVMFSALTSKLMLSFLTPALWRTLLSWKVSLVCTFNV